VTQPHKDLTFQLEVAPGLFAKLVAFYLGEAKFWVQRLYVPRAYRGQGHGRKLMAQLLEHADNNQFSLQLIVAPSSNNRMTYHELRAWYIRLGFRQDSEGCMTRCPKYRYQDFREDGEFGDGVRLAK
jgi:ribosomal protein S18 acetylase RimI-like enzyme